MGRCSPVSYAGHPSGCGIDRSSCRDPGNLSGQGTEAKLVLRVPTSKQLNCTAKNQATGRERDNIKVELGPLPDLWAAMPCLQLLRNRSHPSSYLLSLLHTAAIVCPGSGWTWHVPFRSDLTFPRCSLRGMHRCCGRSRLHLSPYMVSLIPIVQ